jgi:uncharacterized protein YdeI (YjbR/CyaY-like superfamily)
MYLTIFVMLRAIFTAGPGPPWLTGGMAQDLPTVSFASCDAWTAWLGEQHTTSGGVWLKIAKAGTGLPTVTYSEALDAALCHGWIDGQKARFDDSYWLQRFGPRTPRSKWSKINRDRAEALITGGHMRTAGLRAIEQARADGRWDAAYDGQRTATVPEDLERELAGNPAAGEFFATLDNQNRYAILYRIQDAKKPETRARRIEKFVGMLANGEKIYP